MDADYQLKVVVADMDHYQKLLLGSLTRIEGVTSVRSSFVLNQVLASTELIDPPSVIAAPAAYTRALKLPGEHRWIPPYSKSG